MYKAIPITNRVASGIPIAHKNDYIPIRHIKWQRDNFPISNNKRTKTTRCSLKVERGEVKEATNLILNLELIGPVPPWSNGTVGSKNSILPRSTAHLYSRPKHQNRILAPSKYILEMKTLNST